MFSQYLSNLEEREALSFGNSQLVTIACNKSRVETVKQGSFGARGIFSRYVINN